MNQFNKPNAGFHSPVQVEPVRSEPAAMRIVSVRVSWRDLWRLAWQLFCMAVVFASASAVLIALFNGIRAALQARG